MVKECIEQGLCTNTLPQILPQGIGNWLYCETCWIHCQQRSQTELIWNTDMEGIECRCKNCSRR